MIIPSKTIRFEAGGLYFNDELLPIKPRTEAINGTIAKLASRLVFFCPNAVVKASNGSISGMLFADSLPDVSETIITPPSDTQ